MGNSPPVRMFHTDEQRRLAGLLKETSRSFHLTLRILPRAVRPQIALAYLLARTSDTIADTEIVPWNKRLAALADFRDRLTGSRGTPLDFGELAQHQGSPAERALLENCETGIALVRTLAPGDAERVLEVLQTILGGQELDLRRFAEGGTDHIVALQSDSELDDYTYRVAGCVGEFWTRMCRTHLFPRATLDDQRLLEDAVRFGKGLQLVNILRDLPSDLRKGRCYLPLARLTEHGLTPADLLSTANETRFRSLYNAWLDQAEAHLRAGWNYTNALPRWQMRIRLACAWPILFGMETLAHLRREAILDPQRRIKIDRVRIRGLVWRSILRYPFKESWKNLLPA